MLTRLNSIHFYTKVLFCLSSLHGAHDAQMPIPGSPRERHLAPLVYRDSFGIKAILFWEHSLNSLASIPGSQREMFPAVFVSCVRSNVIPF